VVIELVAGTHGFSSKVFLARTLARAWYDEPGPESGEQGATESISSLGRQELPGVVLKIEGLILDEEVSKGLQPHVVRQTHHK
jgi:hypothetical protein